MKRAIFIALLLGLVKTAHAAFPTILVDSTNGAASDFTTSGAGPTTALTGTGVATDATGLIVTLSGSPDLTTVSTDGSHVLFMADNTIGKRNFGRITAKDGSLTSTASVTCDAAFSLSISSSIIWAIGGVRATVTSTTSIKILNNNSATGDGGAGWAVEMQSGHSESTATINVMVSGSVTGGNFSLRGKSGAAVRPIITISSNSTGIAINNNRSGVTLQDFDMKNTNATKTNSIAITCANATNTNVLIKGIKIADSTNKFWKGILIAAIGVKVENCEIANTADRGMDIQANGAVIRFNYFHNTTTFGIALSQAAGTGSVIEGNVIASAGNDCIRDGETVSSRNIQGLYIRNNTFNGCAGDGIESAMASTDFGMSNAVIENNIFANNSGYALNFSGTGGTETQLEFLQVQIRNNDFFNNTSGPIFPTTLTISQNAQALDPQYINSGSANYGIGLNLKAKGFLDSTTAIGFSNTNTYIDIGAAQRQEGSADTYVQ